MKKIGLDLDGVVFDSENLYRVYTEIYDVDILRKNSLVDNTKRTFQQRYDWGEEICKKFYNEYAKEVLTTANLMSGANIVIPKLMKYFEFIVVTSRSKEETEWAKDKFKMMGLENIKFIHNKKDKIETFKEEQVDYIIDDEKTTCIDASRENIHAIYFRNAACEKIEENEYLKMVNNWGEIYKYLMLN